MFTRMYINYCTTYRNWRTATGISVCPKYPVWGRFSGILRKCIYYDICITILEASCKQTPYPQKLQLSFLIFRIGPKLNSIQHCSKIAIFKIELQSQLQLLQFLLQSIAILLQLPKFSPWNLESELQLIAIFNY